MFIEVDELHNKLNAAKYGGGSFERFVWAILKEEARIHHIPLEYLHWDYRVNVPDRGQDMLVEYAHGEENYQLIPPCQTIFSVKGGYNGVSPATLSNELSQEKHPDLIRLLRNGTHYVWCALAQIDADGRTKMRNKATELAKNLELSEYQIHFFWDNHWEDMANRHPCVIWQFFPELTDRFSGVYTLEQWLRESQDNVGLNTPWTNFQNRDGVKKRIQEHLFDINSESPVLHLTGLSGIGKTRTAIEACREENSLHNTLYAPKYEEISSQFLRYVERKARSIQLIVDEVHLRDVDHIISRFTQTGVKLITLGPASENDQSTNKPDILILLKPNIESMTAVLHNSQYGGLSEEQIENIANLSAHDLRFALMLSADAECNTDAPNVAQDSIESIWKRVIDRFTPRIQDRQQFRKCYEHLTSAIDIGWEGSSATEIAYLSQYFGQNETDMKRCIEEATNVGLGIKTKHYFEAIPRALAVALFSECLWPTINSDEFIRNMPTERLQRRFFERCHEVTGPRRKTIMKDVGNFFLKQMQAETIVDLANREKSRTFQAWAEFDPERGLSWLKRAVTNADKSQLEALDGRPDGSGGWRGRRQVVWVCEHLAYFKEYFYDCEEILFCLAQAETETDIGNNSREIWKCLFLPVYSHTNEPFEPRLQKLLHRLKQANEHTLHIVLGAVSNILAPPTGRIVPPPVVGGRLVPKEWCPHSEEERRKLTQDAGRRALSIMENLQATNMHSQVFNWVLDNMREMLDNSLIEEAKKILSQNTLGNDETRKLRIRLDEITAEERMVAKDRKTDLSPEVKKLIEWRSKLRVETLPEKIRDLTARRPYWADDETEDEVDVRYINLAKEIITKPTILDELVGWFESDECLSGNRLGVNLGKADANLTCFNIIRQWLTIGRCKEFVSAYIQGYSLEQEGMPDGLASLLDQQMQTDPALVADISLRADLSQSGFDRTVKCIPLLKCQELGVLRIFGMGIWQKPLTIPNKQVLLHKLTELDCEHEEHWRVAIDDLLRWYHGGVLEEDLVDTAFEVWVQASRVANVDHLKWIELGKFLAEYNPKGVAQAMASLLPAGDIKLSRRRKFAEEELKEIAKSNPTIVMDEIGSFLEKEPEGQIFEILVFEGLFDAIGIEAVRRWLSGKDVKCAVRIVRHLNGPVVDEDGNPEIPQLVDWLLKEYGDSGDVFNSFVMGLHSDKTRVGWIRNKAEVRREFFSNFEEIPTPWVQRWLKYEKEHLQREIEEEEYIEEKMERE